MVKIICLKQKVNIVYMGGKVFNNIQVFNYNVSAQKQQLGTALSVLLFVCLFIVCLFVYLFVYLFVCLCACFFTCLF